MNSSTKILIGLLAGLFVGIFFGEYASGLKVVADGFVKLLQMTVLPYITLSIITSLGALRYTEVKTLGRSAGAILLGVWAFALSFTFLFPLAFPAVDTASFFSTTLIEERPDFNFVGLFIPSNPFYSDRTSKCGCCRGTIFEHCRGSGFQPRIGGWRILLWQDGRPNFKVRRVYSLANNVVPAVVLFSVFVGIALIGVERKQVLIDVFAVAREALSRTTKFVVGLTPYGIFAIAANTAGTMGFE